MKCQKEKSMKVDTLQTVTYIGCVLVVCIGLISILNSLTAQQKGDYNKIKMDIVSSLQQFCEC